jgi:hypothetical protein
MKTIKNILTLTTIMICFTACTMSTKSDQSTDVDRTTKEYTSAYICPMHCEGSGSDTMGTCPVCEMKYKENKNANSAQ